MRRADRLFRLVRLLRSHRVVTAAQLAAELGVSKRTVYRDIRDLEGSGVRVEGEAGVGYRLARGYELPPLTFNTDELEALVLGARMVQAWGDPELGDAARAALEKVEAVVPVPLRDVLGRTALFVPYGWQDPPESLGPLRQAVARRRKVRFAYSRRDGTSSRRTVRPLGLYFWGRSWSLAGWCELRSDWRNFRPDRMAGLEVLDEAFDPDDGIDLAAFMVAMRERDGHPSG